AANYGAKIGHPLVENMSIGGPDPSQLLDDAITYVESQGDLIVVAAGENLPQGGPVFYPAAYPGCVAVGAVDQYNNYQA
ncbi:S8 family serine peptidase, partial [Klebsiella pneumoniae]|nr:S8 family serine peptidase [Klebsiella pneumoniae]